MVNGHWTDVWQNIIRIKLKIVIINQLFLYAFRHIIIFIFSINCSALKDIFFSSLSPPQISTSGHQHLNPIITALPFGLKSSSNGSLSDSGISDGGGSSDYGLSERERRLSALRRLARQLENALAPGSEAIQSISQRMEAAEADLRSLQDTCRQLIVKTAATQQHQHEQQLQKEQRELMQKPPPPPLPATAPALLLPPPSLPLHPPKQVATFVVNGKTKQKRSPQR